MNRKTKTNDLTGLKFGKWEVVKRVNNNNHGSSMWECRCECGKISIIPGANLRTGRTRGCKSCNSGGHGKSKKHGLRNDKIYQTWKNMRSRCYNVNNKDYKNYGGRGVSVFPEWQYYFISFYDYVSNLPNFGKHGMTLDRINVNGNYEPDNLRWATRYEQVHNRRKK